MFRLIGSDGQTPALHDAQQFELVSSEIPSSWAVGFRAAEHLELGPRPWLEQGFWVRFFDGDEDAVSVFNREVRREDQTGGGASSSRPDLVQRDKP